MPIPPVMTGMVLLSRHSLCKLSPPLGIIRSIKSFRRSISRMRARSGSLTNWTASTGSPWPRMASCTTRNSAWLLLRLSLPPRSIAPLPLLIASAAMSMVTLGRLS